MSVRTPSPTTYPSGTTYPGPLPEAPASHAWPGKWKWALQTASGATLTTLASATDRSLSFRRSDTAEAGFRLDLLHEDATILVDALANGVPVVRVWRDETSSDGLVTPVCRFAGIVTAVEDSADEDASMTVTVRGPAFKLDHRVTDILDEDDAGTLAAQLITEANADSPTGIAIGSVQATTVREVDHETKSVLDAIEDLSQLDPGGFDWEIVPNGTGSTLGTFTVYATQGQDRPSALFGHGAGTVGNVSRVGRNWKPPVNHVRVIGSEGFYIELSNATSISKHGKWVHVESMTDVDDDIILLARATELLEPEWTKTVSFEPDPSLAPSPFTDYWLGDTVRLTVDRGAMQSATSPRIDEIAIRLDDEGNEASHELTIAE